MIKFKCNNCNHQIEAPQKYAGKRVRCPKCKVLIRVPESVGKTGTPESELIKFRCPSCNQKMRITPDYAGKQVRCAKCKKPLRIPQASSQSVPPTAEDQTAVLRAGQEQQPKKENIWDDLENMDELLFAEAHAPSAERQKQPGEFDYESKDSESSVYTGQGAYAQRQISSDRPKKKRSKIFIGAACVLVLLLVGIAVWSVGSDSGSIEREMEVELSEVQEFTEDYIGLLSEGKIDEARELLSSELQSDAENSELERLAEYLGKSDIEKLDCRATNFEVHPEGNQFFLCYMFRYEDESHNIVLSVLEIDKEFAVTGIAVRESFGNTISIGPRSYKELKDIAFAATLAKIKSVFTKFFCGFAVVILVACLLQTISMWIVFEKAGEPGWAAIVPYYNMWVLAEVGDKPGWLGLLFCFGGAIPFVGSIVVLVLWAVISIGVARAFGRGVGFGIGLALVPIVFYPILAFTSD